MPSLAALQEIFWSIVGPWQFLWVSASYLPGTVTTLVRERKWDVLLSPAKLRWAWFGTFWGSFGPNVKLMASERVVPLLAGRATGGRVTEEVSGPRIEGTVLELGAGSGYWVDVFAEYVGDPDRDLAVGGDVAPELRSRRGRDAEKRVVKVYGVEPSRDQHASLRRHVKQAGLEEVYEIVPVGIEDLDNPAKWNGKIEKGSIDCIVSILCLCSIPEPEKNFKELYEYLRSGGRWYVYEHVRADVNWGVRLYQAFVNLFWPHFIGGCQLCRPTEKWLREAGAWSKIDIGQPPDEPWHKILPHRLGVFTKE